MFSSLNSSPTPSSSSLLSADRSKEPGKSMAMMDTFTDFSMVGVYEKNRVLKFVHVKSEKFSGRFTILIFMDDKLSELEIEEWKDFSNHIKYFKQAGASVVGVCTDSQISWRTMMMSSLQGISFPIISDRDGDFSRAFGVLKVKNVKFGASRAMVILDREVRMVDMTLHSEYKRSYPGRVVQLIKKLQVEAEESTETRVGDFGTKPTISDASGSASTEINSANVSTKETSSRVSMSAFTKTSKAPQDTSSPLENTKNGSNSGEASDEKKSIENEDKKTVDDKKHAEKKPSPAPSIIKSILSHPMLLTADAKKPSDTSK